MHGSTPSDTAPVEVTSWLSERYEVKDEEAKHPHVYRTVLLFHPEAEDRAHFFGIVFAFVVKLVGWKHFLDTILTNKKKGLQKLATIHFTERGQRVIIYIEEDVNILELRTLAIYMRQKFPGLHIETIQMYPEQFFRH